MTQLPKKIITVIGPTASGKTALALKIAHDFQGVIISADSRQIYQDLNIGTAKIKPNEQQGIKHYLLDIIPPTENYSVADFKQTVDQLIANLNQLPILTGGTGLYLRAVVNNYHLKNSKPNLKLRTKLEKDTPLEIWKKLVKITPLAKKLDPTNPRRLIRAWENWESYGLLQVPAQNPKPKYKSLQIGIQMPRAELYQRINSRVDQMIKDGLVAEVTQLLQKYPSTAPGLQSIGYRQIINYLHQEYDLPTAIEKIKQASRQYSRKQIAWFKKDPDINWFDYTTNPAQVYSSIKQLIQKFLA